MRRHHCFAVLAATAASASLLFALPAGALIALPKECASKLSTLPIKTGVDEASNTVLPQGAADQTWTVISDPDPGTTEPRPATVIPKYPAWSAPLPGTQWISSFATSANDLNGLYQLETCFCLGPGFHQTKLSMTLLADDWAEVFLNGSSIGATNNTLNFQTPTSLATSNQALFKAGRNCIRVDLKNTANVAMGLDLSATVQTAGVDIERPACCVPTASLSGRKWNDLNGDGQMQTNEPPLPGWVIKLSNGQVAVTDSLGYYYFLNLPPGSYVVAEQLQPGWQQTAPLSGTLTANLHAGQAVNNLDFGNRHCPQCTEGQIVFVPAGGTASADLCARLCCKKGEYPFQNSCGCGCSTKPPCPEIGTPGIRYVSRDPKVCATVKFFCKDGEMPFSNECGCGCEPAVSPVDKPTASDQ